MGAILDALRALGGMASSQQVYEHLKSSGIAKPTDLATVQTSNETRFVKEVRFARNELVGAGLLTRTDGGIWQLSHAGWGTVLNLESARALVRIRRHGSAKVSQKRAIVTRPFSPGPPPGSWSTWVSRPVAEKYWTYIFRYGHHELWKIGFSSDVAARLRDINTHVPVEVTGESWSAYAQMNFESAALAFRMEQSLLGLLAGSRTFGERVKCSEAELQECWRTAAQQLRT